MAQDARLTELETKVAFIEQTMHTLDQRMIEQQQAIDKLETWCKTLADRMRQASEGPTGNGFEIPPHY